MTLQFMCFYYKIGLPKNLAAQISLRTIFDIYSWEKSFIVNLYALVNIPTYLP
jgi:hypothetical protein